MSDQRKQQPVESRIEAQLHAWLASFPVDEVRAEIERLELLRVEIDTKLAQLRDRFTLWRSADGFESGQQPVLAGGRRISKKVAVLELLSEAPGAEFRLVELRRELVRRGWIEDNHRAAHALEVAVLDLAKRGEIERPRKGVYRLPARSEDAERARAA